MSQTIYPYTYCITFIPTQQKYIGVRWGNKMPAADDFWHIYFTTSAPVKALIDQQGREAFRIDWIRTHETKEEAQAAETKLLRENDVVHNAMFLNQAIGVYTDNTGRKHTPEAKEKIRAHNLTRKATPETKEKLSLMLLGNKRALGNTNMLGKKHSAESKKKMSKSSMGAVPTIGMTGKKHSPETIEKMRVAKMGNVPWNKGKKGQHKHTPETIEKMSVTRMGKKKSPETREKMCVAQKRRRAMESGDGNK